MIMRLFSSDHCGYHIRRPSFSYQSRPPHNHRHPRLLPHHLQDWRTSFSALRHSIYFSRQGRHFSPARH